MKRGSILGVMVAATLGCTGCVKVTQPEDGDLYQGETKVVAAMADVSEGAASAGMTTTQTTGTTATTTVTTTTTEALCAPFIDTAYEVDPDAPMVALTFDDGPSSYTNDILDVLEQYDAHATFFIVGENITEYNGAYVQRAVELGCEIGSHTNDHCDLTSVTAEGRRQTVEQADAAIYDLIGRYPYWLRPPYGAFDDAVQADIGKPLAYWSVDTKDWSTRDTASTVNAVLTNVEDGDIVLMHDIYEPTAAAAAQVIPTLVGQGYQLVTMSELAYYRGLELEDGMVVFNLHPGAPNYKAPAGTEEEPPTEAATVCDGTGSGYGAGSDDCDGTGFGYGAGSDDCDGMGSGYGAGSDDCDGTGSGYGAGSDDCDGTGSGYGAGDGTGYGAGNGYGAQ